MTLRKDQRVERGGLFGSKVASTGYLETDYTNRCVLAGGLSSCYLCESRTMVCRSKILAAALFASAAAFIVPVSAADLDGQGVYTDDANFVKSAELGSGWYMRGDVSYNFNLGQERGFEYDPIVGLPSLRYNIGDSFGYGVGMGKQLTSLIRADVTVDRTASSQTVFSDFRSFSGTRRFEYTDATDAVINSTVSFDRFGTQIGNSCSDALCQIAADNNDFAIGGTETIDTSYAVFSVLANGYVDLATIAGITPYVGGGIGFARPAVNLVHTVTCSANDDEACGFPGGDYGEVVRDYELINDTYAKWLPTYAIAAGASYDLTQNVKLDFGYRFQHIMNIDSVLDGANLTDTTLLDNKDTVHSVRLGVRISTW